MHYVYILECADGTLYTGYATDVARRVEAHNRGKGAKYTRSRLPVRLAYSEPQPTRGDALRREAAIKKLPRAKKLALIQTLRHSPTQHNRHSPT
jgi:putative endonuclease